MQSDSSWFLKTPPVARSPVLAWPWGVEHVLEERDDGTVVVVRHLESWDVSAGEGVRQLLSAGAEKRV